MSSAPEEIRFDSILSRRSAGTRTALFVFPAIVAIVAIVVFAAVAISRMSGLQTQLQAAQQQAQDANKVVEERDRQIRDAQSETAVLASVGQGAGVLAATSKESTASGVVLDHPAQHALAVYAFNLLPPPEGQEYRLIVTDGMGAESLLGALRPDDRGGSFLMARDVPEGLAKVEIALVPTSATKPAPDQVKGSSGGPGSGAAEAKVATAQKAPAERKPVLTGALPRPGEAGVVIANASAGGDKNLPRRGERTGRRGR
jgi:hypothetical protein